MKKQLLEELKVIKKYMYYSESKTDSENLRLLEVEGPNPEGNSGGSPGGGTRGGSGRRALIQIPSELANSAGVKKFQDWLVANNFGSELGRFGADSKFGNFTKAAWDKHKSDYLNPVESGLIPGNDITNVEPSSVQSQGGSSDPSGVTEPSSVVVDPSTVSQQDQVASGGTPPASEDITQNI